MNAKRGLKSRCNVLVSLKNAKMPGQEICHHCKAQDRVIDRTASHHLTGHELLNYRRKGILEDKKNNQNLPLVLRIIFVSPLTESACPRAMPNALNTASHWW